MVECITIVAEVLGGIGGILLTAASLLVFDVKYIQVDMCDGKEFCESFSTSELPICAILEDYCSDAAGIFIGIMFGFSVALAQILSMFLVFCNQIKIWCGIQFGTFIPAIVAFALPLAKNPHQFDAYGVIENPSENGNNESYGAKMDFYLGIAVINAIWLLVCPCIVILLLRRQAK